MNTKKILAGAFLIALSACVWLGVIAVALITLLVFVMTDATSGSNNAVVWWALCAITLAALHYLRKWWIEKFDLDPDSPVVP